MTALPRRILLAAVLALAAALAIGFAASAKTDGDTDQLAGQLAAARLATGKYVTDLDRAKADGYSIITRMVPDMGWHFMNPKIQKFDPRRPPILVYERHGRTWQLAALEWVFPSTPETPPFPGARYGSFPAACHYVDGTFQPSDTEEAARAAARRAAPGSTSGTARW